MNELLVTKIRNNYLRCLEEISNASSQSGKLKVKLVVVSKAQPLNVIQAAYQAGITVFGENYADEAVQKILALEKTEVEWHMIGHVQSRKASLVAQYFSALHSLDSIKLASRLEQLCSKSGRTLPVLLEVNISGETSKQGFPAWDEESWSKLLPEFERIFQFPHLTIRGLMTMPPYFTNPELSRPFFRRMRNLQGFLVNQLPEGNWTELSMGTSIDFQEAIEEGATIVRIGEAILGKRPSKRII